VGEQPGQADAEREPDPGLLPTRAAVGVIGLVAVRVDHDHLERVPERPGLRLGLGAELDLETGAERLQNPRRFGFDLGDRGVLDDQGGDPVAAVRLLEEEVALDLGAEAFDLAGELAQLLLAGTDLGEPFLAAGFRSDDDVAPAARLLDEGARGGAFLLENGQIDRLERVEPGSAFVDDGPGGGDRVRRAAAGRRRAAAAGSAP
jgi:hypothetical protein